MLGGNLLQPKKLTVLIFVQLYTIIEFLVRQHSRDKVRKGRRKVREKEVIWKGGGYEEGRKERAEGFMGRRRGGSEYK